VHHVGIFSMVVNQGLYLLSVQTQLLEHHIFNCHLLRVSDM